MPGSVIAAVIYDSFQGRKEFLHQRRGGELQIEVNTFFLFFYFGLVRVFSLRSRREMKLICNGSWPDDEGTNWKFKCTINQRKQ